MRLPSVLTLGAVLPEPARAVGVRRHGRRLLLVRGGWLALAGLSAGMFLAGIRAEFAQLQLACAAASCPPDQLPPTGVQALRDLGLSLRFYATYAVAMDVVVAAGYG